MHRSLLERIAKERLLLLLNHCSFIALSYNAVADKLPATPMNVWAARLAATQSASR
ncbi:hypothetical protein [Paenibacillus roseipurpureus]|uniref:Uncharacterized protein n=1 Tax=Paenibacillus roseopurpureus TaxID=2918901 RepID=A0AA96LP80_9BACL|nr:hypothetical protein [Paenibacillus sp. MBLB1832]WNR45692.1 hypothetical protein MJB10_06215 [Paenibacillus sp. MBLB1832]